MKIIVESVCITNDTIFNDKRVYKYDEKWQINHGLCELICDGNKAADKIKTTQRLKINKIYTYKAWQYADVVIGENNMARTICGAKKKSNFVLWLWKMERMVKNNILKLLNLIIKIILK